MSFVSKLLWIGTAIILFVWTVPSFMNYRKNMQEYKSKVVEIEESYLKYKIMDNAKEFNVEEFKKEAEVAFLDITVTPLEEGEYRVLLQLEKDKTEEIYPFIERVSLHYLVKIKNSELRFKEKNQTVEVQFTLEEL